MVSTVTVGIIGDADESHPAHKVTDSALNHAAKHLSIEANISWIPTKSLLTPEGQQRLKQFDGVLAAPGGAYQSPDGAVSGIQFAREQNYPFLGT